MVKLTKSYDGTPPKGQVVVVKVSGTNCLWSKVEGCSSPGGLKLVMTVFWNAGLWMSAGFTELFVVVNDLG